MALVIGHGNFMLIVRAVAKLAIELNLKISLLVGEVLVLSSQFLDLASVDLPQSSQRFELTLEHLVFGLAVVEKVTVVMLDFSKQICISNPLLLL
jgi:hypothetical protein